MRNNPIPKVALFDYLMAQYTLKDSNALAQFLDVSQSLISKVRHGMRPITADLILRVYDKTNLSIESIRQIMGEKDGSNA